MKFPRVKEETGEITVAVCQMCGGEIYQGEPYYERDGEVICEVCLEDYARRCFAPFLVEGGEV